MSLPHLRKAAPGEARALGELGFASWAHSIFAEHDAGRVDRESLLADFVSFAEGNSDTMLVAEMNGAPVGWGAREDYDHRISDLWVAPDWQGRGVGSALLLGLEARIRADGYRLVELETLSANQRAIDFYLRHGFVIAWHAEKFSSSLGYAIDKVGLNKSL